MIAPLVSSELRRRCGETCLGGAVFAVGVGLTALAFVLDQALIGLLRGGLQLIRNVVFSVVKLLALIPIAVLVADAGAPWIYGAWTAGIAISLVVLDPLLPGQRGRPAAARLRPSEGDAGPRGTHHAVNLALETADLAMPILVVTFLTASANASFYIAWMIASFLFMVPLSLSTVLFAVGSGESKRLADRFKLTVYVSLGFGVVSNLALLVLGTPLLEIFGASYANEAKGTLHILALDIFPSTVMTHYVALRRIERRLATALPVIWGGALLQVGGGLLGAVLGDGLSAVAIGWVAGATVEAIVMGPEVLRALRSEHIVAVDDGEPAEDEAEAIGLLRGDDRRAVLRRYVRSAGSAEARGGSRGDEAASDRRRR